MHPNFYLASEILSFVCFGAIYIFKEFKKTLKDKEEKAEILINESLR